MPRIVLPEDLEILIAPIAKRPEGMSLAEIERALEEKIPRRTLQRRIAALVDRKRLEVIGEGRSTP